MISKKGFQLSAQAVVIFLLLLGVAIIGLIIVGKSGGLSKSIAPTCNTELARCACFYRGGSCPDAFQMKKTNSESCPLNTVQCTSTNYDSEVAKASKNAGSKRGDDRNAYFGTCCQAPTGKVSATRLWEYQPATATGTTPGGEPSVNAQADTGITLPQSPPEITVDFTRSSAVKYRYVREGTRWEYRGNALGWGNVASMGWPYADAHRQIARDLSSKTEAEGYVLFRQLRDSNNPALESISGNP